MRIRFRTVVVLQLIAFFAGMVAMLYILSTPTSQIRGVEQKLVQGCNIVVENVTKLVKYARNRNTNQIETNPTGRKA